jgi:repressor LexA
MDVHSTRGRPAGPTARSARGLTARQEAVLAVIDTWCTTYGYPPTLREMGKVVGLASPSSVLHHVHTLEAVGYLHKDAKRPRCYVLTGLARRTTPLRSGRSHAVGKC